MTEYSVPVTAPERPADVGARVRWGMVDQAVSSVTNFGISIVVAHHAEPEQFGVFTIVFTIYILSMWVARSLVHEPFVMRFSAAPPIDQRLPAGGVVGAAVLLGAVLGVALGIVAAAVGGSTGALLAAMAVSLPGLLAQDAYRYVLLAAGRSRAAATNDAIWLGTQALLVVALLVSGNATPANLTLVFGSGAAVAAATGAFQSVVTPALSRAWQWVASQSNLGLPLVVELLVVNGSPQSALFGAAAVGGSRVAGSVRAATLLFGPLTMLFSGAVLVGLPEAVRMRERGTGELRLFVSRLGLAMPLCTAVWALVLMALPDRLGEAALGPNWGPAQDLVPAVSVLIGANAATFAALIGLRALGAARASLRARVWSVPVIIVAATVGSAIAGAGGAAAGLALGSCVDSGMAWTALLRTLRAEADRSAGSTSRSGDQSK